MKRFHQPRAAFFLLLALVGPAHLQAQEKIAVGLGSFSFTPDGKMPERTIKVWTCCPKDLKANTPIVFVMHGVKRNGETYRNNWALYSQRDGFLLIVPEFPESQYPSESYSQGNITDKAGKPRPEAWTFTILERLFDHVKTQTGNRSEKYYLYGHSAGGQFVHRFVLFMPKARYARAVAANPGFYTIPTQAEKYPYGLKGTHVKGAIDPSFFGRDFVLLLGEKDTDRNDPNLRKTPQADAQGQVRFERGQFYFKAAKKLAAQERAPFNWKLLTVPDVGHSDAKMSKSAAQVLLAK